MLNEIHAELTKLRSKPPITVHSEYLSVEPTIKKFAEKIFHFRSNWQLYWFNDNKPLHDKKVKEIKSLCNTLLNNGYQQYRFQPLFDQLFDDVK